MPTSEASRLVEAVENELFYQSNSLVTLGSFSVHKFSVISFFKKKNYIHGADLPSSNGCQHDYIDSETLFDRIFVVSQRKFNDHIVSKSKNNGLHAEASNLIGAQFKSGSSLPQLGWAEHPGN